MRDHRSIKVACLGIVGAGLIDDGRAVGIRRERDRRIQLRDELFPSGSVTIKNPDLGKCYPTKGAASGVNGTNIAAQIFRDGDCKEIAATLAPGQSDNMISFASVKFAEAGTAPAVPGAPTMP